MRLCSQACIWPLTSLRLCSQACIWQCMKGGHRERSRAAAGAWCTLSCGRSDRSMCACRLQAWFRPHNPGMTAAEALCAPFFTAVIDPETAGNDNNV